MRAIRTSVGSMCERQRSGGKLAAMVAHGVITKIESRVRGDSAPYGKTLRFV